MNTTTNNRLQKNDRNGTLSPEVTRPRERTQEAAQRLALIALRNWEKALTGIVALPAAAALSTAATVLFATSILERTFEGFETVLSDVGRRVGEEFDVHGDLIVRDGKDSFPS
jgi:hypothetical protein